MCNECLQLPAFSFLSCSVTVSLAFDDMIATALIGSAHWFDVLACHERSYSTDIPISVIHVMATHIIDDRVKFSIKYISMLQNNRSKSSAGAVAFEFSPSVMQPDAPCANYNHTWKKTTLKRPIIIEVLKV